MLSETTCGFLLLLVLAGVAVALAMNAFLHLGLLPLGADPMLVTLLATKKTLVAVVPAVPLCFHPSGLGPPPCVVFGSSHSVKIGLRSNHRSSVTPFGRFPACSIFGPYHSLVLSSLVNDVEQSFGVMHQDFEPRPLFQLAVTLDRL